jgi:hypothetical protein
MRCDRGSAQRWSVAGAVLAALVTVAAAAAQVEKIRTVQPGVALTDAHAAYAGEPTAERVRIAIRARAGALLREEMVVRIRPGKAGNHEPRRVALELGELRVVTVDGTLLATNIRNETACYAAEFDGEVTTAVLDRLLPPLPVPQLALAGASDPSAGGAGTAEVSDGWTPYTPHIVWERGTIDEVKRSDVVVLTGRSEPAPDGSGLSGTVAVAIDVHTGRLRRLEAKLADGDLELTMEFDPIATEPAPVWSISETGRTRLKQLSELRARPGDLVPGRPVPEIGLIDLDWKPWEIRSVLGREGAAKVDWLALVLVTDAGAEDGAAAKSAVEPLLLRPQQSGQGAMVVVFIAGGAGADTRAKVRAAAERWGPGMLWTASREKTLDRFAPGAGAALVIISADRTLRCIVALDGRGADSARIAEEVQACLSPGAVSLPAPLGEAPPR